MLLNIRIDFFFLIKVTFFICLKVWNDVFESDNSEEVDEILENTFKTLKRVFFLLDSDDSLNKY